jgi:EF hand
MISTRYCIALLAALALAGAANAQSVTPSPGVPQLPRDIENRFKAADITHRGGLNKTEAASAGFEVEEQFDVVDTDKDHIITLFEIGSYLAKRTRDWAAADTDGDGEISRDEADRSPSLAKIFTRADRNSDGIVRKEEQEAFSQTSLYQNVDLPYVVPNIINKKF